MSNLDTRSKRASSVGIMLSFMLAPVLPDGTIAEADRLHIAFSYSGILPPNGIPTALRTIKIAYQARDATIEYENRTVTIKPQPEVLI